MRGCLRFAIFSVVFTFLIISCNNSPPDSASPEEVIYTKKDTLGIVGNEAIPNPGIPVAGPEGRLYLLASNRVAEVSPEGRVLNTFGQEGKGPGELSGADRLLSHDKYVVIHHPNRVSLSLYSPDGEFQRTVLLELPNFPPSVISVQGDRLLAGSADPDRGVASLTSLRNQKSDAVVLGDSTIGTVSSKIDVEQFHQSIDRREVPEQFRDDLRTLFDDGQNAYLIYLAYGRVQKFSPDGRLLWDVEITFHEKEEIFDKFIADNSGGGMIRFQPLRFFTDAGHYDGRLQLMSQVEKAEGNSYSFLLEVDDETGRVVRRINFPALNMLPRRFLYRQEDKRIYLWGRQSDNLVRISPGEAPSS